LVRSDPRALVILGTIMVSCWVVECNQAKLQIHLDIQIREALLQQPMVARCQEPPALTCQPCSLLGVFLPTSTPPCRVTTSCLVVGSTLGLWWPPVQGSPHQFFLQDCLLIVSSFLSTLSPNRESLAKSVFLMVLSCSRQEVEDKEGSQFTPSRLLRASSSSHSQELHIHSTSKVDRVRQYQGLLQVFLLSIWCKDKVCNLLVMLGNITTSLRPFPPPHPYLKHLLHHQYLPHHQVPTSPSPSSPHLVCSLTPLLTILLPPPPLDKSPPATRLPPSPPAPPPAQCTCLPP